MWERIQRGDGISSTSFTESGRLSVTSPLSCANSADNLERERKITKLTVFTKDPSIYILFLLFYSKSQESI